MGFVSFLVRPLYVALARVVPDLAFYTDRVDDGLAMWTRLRAEAMAATGALPPPPPAITVPAAERARRLSVGMPAGYPPPRPVKGPLEKSRLGRAPQ